MMQRFIGHTTMLLGGFLTWLPISVMIIIASFYTKDVPRLMGFWLLQPFVFAIMPIMRCSENDKKLDQKGRQELAATPLIRKNAIGLFVLSAMLPVFLAIGMTITKIDIPVSVYVSYFFASSVLMNIGSPLFEIGRRIAIGLPWIWTKPHITEALPH